jgi:Protein of unknown function (DUF1559)
MLRAVLVVATACGESLADQREETERAQQLLPITFSLSTDLPTLTGTVEGGGSAGDLRIKRSDAKPGAKPSRDLVVEGFYLGLVGPHLPSLVDAQLLRVRVRFVDEAGLVTAEVGRGISDSIPRRAAIMLLRPRHATTEQMMALPDLATIEPPATDEETKSELDSGRAERSAGNLKKIGEAQLSFLQSYNHFPPASLVGPDGKPWHSWRVMLLPHLDYADLFTRYRFDEPWDGPHNKLLVDQMPAVYTDASPGKVTDHFTRYAAVTGEGMAFSAAGYRFDGTKPQYPPKSGIKFSDCKDGPANTLIVGTVAPDSKIPWSKPEDVVIDGNLAGLGRKGEFAAPYKSAQGNFGLFVLLDGSVVGVRDVVDSKQFRSMLTIAGNEPLELLRVKGAFRPPAGGRPDNEQAVHIFRDGGKVRARATR